MQLFRFPFRAMGGPCQLRFFAATEAEARSWASIAIDEVARLESKYSRYREDSVTSRINAQAHEGIRLDDETALLLDYADRAHAQSDRLFDITSGVLRNAWDFKSGALPSQAEIDALLPLIGWHKVTWEKPYLEFPVRGMELDFGGYVKEYAADAAATACRDAGAAHGIVELGGDISVIGPPVDASGWNIGIRDPRRPECAAIRLRLGGGGLATSGDYERYMIVDGRRYCHLLSPHTGWPVDSCASVSVVADHCLLAGSFSSIAMLKGEDRGLPWLRSVGLPFYCITQDGKIHRA